MAEKFRPRRDHLAVAREAGHGRFSLLSILAGTLTSYGAFAILAAIAAALLAAAEVETDFRTNDWAGSGAIGGLVTALVLFVAYLFGGYVAGRMARRSGLAHGVAVFVVGLLAGAIAGGVVGALSDGAEVERNLRSIGVPTSADELTGVGVAGAVASLAGMAIGATLGGALGERWHTKLARRAADPAYGPAADARRAAERADAEARRAAEHADADREGHLERDELVRRDTGRAAAPGTGETPATIDVRDEARAGDDEPGAEAEGSSALPRRGPDH